MKSSHAVGVIDVEFDDPHLVADAGLVTDRLKIKGAGNAAGVNPGAKAMSLVAAGADSIDDMARLRLGALSYA
jgi:hypothetical protein